MSEPSWPIQQAVFAALKNSTELRGFVGTRIFDQVPRHANGDPNTQKPYVTIGEDQIIADKSDCVDGAEAFVTIHAWSAGVGHGENKRIASAIKTALDGQDLAIEGHHLTDIEFEDARYLVEPDGLTRHAVLTFRALTEPIGA